MGVSSYVGVTNKINMFKIKKVRDCVKILMPRMELSPEILQRARLPMERMLEISAR
jgi:quinolinate synthase